MAKDLSKQARKNARRKKKAEIASAKFQSILNYNGSILLDIQKPKTHSEFETQAMLFNKLSTSGYDVRGEVPYKKGGRLFARFDLVVFNPRGKDIIIEVKKGQKRKTQVSTTQRKKYSIFNASLLYCIGNEQVDETISAVDKLMSN